jgi:hypothetical protein
MHCADSDYALRLFLKNLEDQAERYASISNFVQHDSLPYTVTFDFLSNGIKVRGDWFPALKMDWVEGTPFEEYVIENINNPDVMDKLSKSFVQMMSELRFAGIAHGDLQHGNIIMCGKELRMVDYDGMYVPALKRLMASELGHPNYQHPNRASHHFGPYLDNFSAWIIYASLRGLQLDPALLHQLGGGDDCLLFRRSDFQNPLQSPAFAAFEKHENEEIKMLGRFVRAQLSTDPEKIPYLQHPVPDINIRLDLIPNSVSTTKDGPRLVRGETADWLNRDNLGALQKPGVTRAEFVQHPLAPGPKIIQARAAHQSVWVKPTANPSPSITVDQSKVDPQLKAPLRIPPELSNNPPPRHVRYVKSYSRISPVTLQWMMLMFPFLWAMLFFFFKAVTVDEYLRVNAKAYDATISNVRRYETASKNGSVSHTDVTASYYVDKRAFFISADMGMDYGHFKQGDVYPVYALPSNPSVHEQFGAKPGNAKFGDLLWAVVSLLVNLVMELLIWFSPIRHKLMSIYGTPVIATVKSLDVTSGSKGDRFYTALVSYSIHPKTYNSRLNISLNEYHDLRVGDTEIMLYDQLDPSRPMFYKFLWYKPVLPSSIYPSIAPSSPSMSALRSSKPTNKPKLKP